MTEKKRKVSPGMNVGSSSILVTFVLLCLVTFAALSFVSARADYNLATQTADRINNYYAKDSTAEAHLANIDSQLLMLASSTNEAEYFDKIESTFSDNEMYVISKNEKDVYISYIVPVSNTQSLNITVKALYPDSNNGSAFKITQWENIASYVPEPETIKEKGGFLF